MQTLQSHVLGRWHAGQGAATQLFNPTTEAPLAEIRAGGIDFKAVASFARDIGGPALRALSFRERGAILKTLSAAIHEQREALISVAVQNGGNTRGDAKFDIDGATGTLAFYAGLAEQLGTRDFLVDGPGVQLGRTPRFFGQHIYVTRPGVAVHINAFNFPAWGMMEKMACSILAGMPVIEKPGTPTALSAWKIAEIVEACGALPRGAYQFIAGTVGDLLDHLGPQDVLAFTGSSVTAAKLRANVNLVRHNVRVNIEADSLNAAVLAPDVEQGSDTYNLFLANVVLDMTQKTGQKCTAVRRILVPSDRVAAVKEDLVGELARIKVGDPEDKATRMGPVSSQAQLADVRAGIDRLARVCETATGGSKSVAPKGWFVAPTLFVARDPNAEAVHSDEVFGPVSTIVAYSGEAQDAARLVQLGGGSLVCSGYSNDAEWLERFALAAAPWSGRVWLASDKLADQALPPGMVLPQMVHGGPGRAGGGEELGAERGLHFYMQRTALQGFKGLLESSFGTPATT